MDILVKNCPFKISQQKFPANSRNIQSMETKFCVCENDDSCTFNSPEPLDKILRRLKNTF